MCEIKIGSTQAAPDTGTPCPNPSVWWVQINNGVTVPHNLIACNMHLAEACRRIHARRPAGMRLSECTVTVKFAHYEITPTGERRVLHYA